jgi:lactoylglutathione lyase
MHVSIQGLFETHLTVRDLATSVAFYQDIVGLELAFTLPERRVAFFWIGGRGQAMLGVWEVGDAPNGMRLHFAFYQACRKDGININLGLVTFARRP